MVRRAFVWPVCCLFVAACATPPAVVSTPEAPAKPQPNAPETPAPFLARPEMDWVPSPHHRKGPRRRDTVDAIAVHTTEGLFRPGVSHEANQRRNYLGTIAYFRNNDRKVSAHFLIGPGGAITQMVREDDIAHTTTYYNARSFGIECAGWGSRRETWTPAMFDSLVELCAYLALTWDIPIEHPEGTAYDSPHAVPTDNPERPHFDAPGLVGHFQVQPWNKHDPGEHFPWDEFVERVRAQVSRYRARASDLLRPPVVRRGQWKAAPAHEEKMRPHEIDRITLHHSGTAVAGWPNVDGPEWMQHLQRFSLRDRPWGDVPYHFSVTPDGTVYAGRDLRFAGDTNTSYDPAGHLLIEAVGNFENDALPDAQRDAIVELMAWACAHHGVPPDRIAGHRDFTDTSCPGAHAYAALESGELVERVRARLATLGLDGQ